jgi:hypothetical protein
MRSAEIPKRTPDDPPPGTFRFTQDFNTNFLRTSNSGTARSELVNVSQNRVCESRRQQDPNPPAEAPESSESRNENQSVQSAKLVEIRLMPQRPNPMAQRR